MKEVIPSRSPSAVRAAHHLMSCTRVLLVTSPWCLHYGSYRHCHTAVTPRTLATGTHHLPRILFLGGDYVSLSVLRHLCDRYDECEGTSASSSSLGLLTANARSALEQLQQQHQQTGMNEFAPHPGVLKRSCIEVVCPPHHHDSRLLTASPVLAFAREQQLSSHEVQHPKSLKKGAFVLPHVASPATCVPFDIALVVSFRYFIHDDYLRAMPRCINVHPSLLPKYRGASPIYSTLRRNESEGGVSIIKIVPGELMDCGDVLLQRSIDIGPAEDIRTYVPRVLSLAGDLVDEVVFGGDFDSFWGNAAVQQRKMRMSVDPYHAPLLKKADSALVWSAMTGSECFGVFRAFAGGSKHGQAAPFSVLHKGATPVAEQLLGRMRRRVRGPVTAAVEEELRAALRTRCTFNEAVPWGAVDTGVHHELSAVIASRTTSGNPLSPGTAYFPSADDNLCCVVCAEGDKQGSSGSGSNSNSNSNSSGGGGGGDGSRGAFPGDRSEVTWFCWRSATLINHKRAPTSARTLRTGMAMKQGVVYDRLFVDPSL